MKVKVSPKSVKSIFAKENRTKLFFALGMLGIILIFLSEILPENDPDTDKNANMKSVQTQDETESYKRQTEEELKNILKKIDGVGDCEVMVTVEGTTEYVYAENLSEYSDTNGDKVSDKKENNVVMIEENGKKQALVKKIIKPKISGVVIVCSGGNDLKINERVLKAASTALNISAGKICVESKT